MLKKNQPAALDSADWLFGALPPPVNDSANKRKQELNTGTTSSNKKPKDAVQQAAPAADPSEPLGMSATQVANMFCDIFSSKGKMRMDHITQCFSEDVTVSPLFASPAPAAPSIQGRAALLAALAALPPAPAEAERRVFIEADADPSPATAATLSLDFYAAGRCPGLDALLEPAAAPADAESAAAEGADARYAVVMYRVQRDKIDAVWVGEAGKTGEVRQAVAAMRLGGARALASTEAWRHVAALVRGAALLGSRWCGLRCHYSDYSAASDGLGLGIGSVSAAETWVEEGDARGAAAAEAAKANLAFERLVPHLSNDAKLVKASKVLVQMLGSSVTPDTRRAAFQAIRAAMGRAGARASAEGTRGVAAEVMAAAEGRRAELEGLGGRAAELLRWWRLHALNVAGLLGDDTFAFAKAAKLVQEELQAMGEKGERYEDGYIRPDRPGGGPGLMDGEMDAAEVESHRAHALLENLSIMVRRYHFAWAKAPVDMVFRVLVDPAVRDLFGPLRPQVEELQDAIARKRQAVLDKESALAYQTAGFQHGRKGW